MAKRKKSQSMSEINVVPMADIMLVLLIIFMITTPMLQSGVTVNLPKAKNPLDAPGAEATDAIVVAINREGRIFMGRDPISEEELYEHLVQRFSGGELNRSMYLKADTALAYGRVVQIVNGVRRAGVDRIGLMADKEKEGR